MSPELLDNVLLQDRFPRTPSSSQRQGSRCVSSMATSAAVRRHRPHLRLRLRSGDRHPAQGPRAQSDFPVLVRLSCRHRAEPPDHRRCRAIPRRDSQVCRPASRTLDAGAPRRDVSCRMRGARIHLRLGLEGIQGDRQSLRYHAACGAERIRSISRAYLHPVDEGHYRA